MLVFRSLLFSGTWTIEIINAGKTSWPFFLVEEKDLYC